MQNNIDVAKELYDAVQADTNRIAENRTSEFQAELVSKNTFEELQLNPNLIQALHSEKIDKPSLIQQMAIPIILSGLDCAFHSKSGTGKTLGFTAGILNQIVPGGGPQAIIITPTRELNLQVADVIRKIAKRIGMDVAIAVKEFSEKEVKQEVVIGCPGKILQLLNSKNIERENIRMIVLDEADHMIANRTFGAQTLKLLKILEKAQKIFFSATYSALSKEAVRTIAPNGHLNFSENTKAKNIKLFYVEVGRNDKIDLIKRLFELLPLSQTIIFANSKKIVNVIGKKLNEDGHAVSLMHGEIPVENRDSIFKDFAEAKTKILLTTDVFSRGIDIPQVNLIINYDIPGDHFENAVETYIHRIGRSGRFNRDGFVIDLISGPEDFEQMLKIHTVMETATKLFSLEALEEIIKHE